MFAGRKLQRALRELQGGDVPQAVDDLVGLVGRSPPRVRASAVRALGGRLEPAARVAVLGAMHDPDRDVRVEATRGVADMAGPEALQALIEAHGDPANFGTISRESLQALEERPRPQTVQALVMALDQPWHSVSAADALMRMNLDADHPGRREARRILDEQHKWDEWADNLGPFLE